MACCCYRISFLPIKQSPGEAFWEVWQSVSSLGLEDVAGFSAEHIQGFIVTVFGCWIAAFMFGVMGHLCWLLR